jgi:LPS-assembly protein
MKNNFLVFSLLIFLTFSFKVFSDEFEINSSKIQYDNNGKVTILEKNVSVKDVKGNKLFSEYAKYNKIEEIIQTKGETQIVTSGGYKVYGSNVVFNKKNNKIFSNDAAKIIDKDGNTILVDMFDYSTLNNIFFSKGNIKISDINKNKYNFSEVYIDENKKKIIGSDIKAFLDQPKISINPENNPRFFANTMSSSKKKNIFNKGVFTYCKNREGEKCPPWSLQSEKIEHDLATKTIYYDNVVLKVYDFPIFYSPKFSHPDPTVKRRSGLLAPSLTNSTTLGSGFATPYFWNISNDKDLTITPKFYLKENPLVLAEFRQDFKNSFLFVDTGYTPGYKKKMLKNRVGVVHIFSQI